VAFAVYDGEGFILQVQGIFTRISSGTTAVVSGGGALGSKTFATAVARTTGDSWLDLLGMAAMRGVKNPKSFGFYL
jgi:hypothetical protein